MSRKKATAYDLELKAAAKMLGRDRDDWSVQRLAHLTLLWKVAQHRWSESQTAANTDQVVSLMDAITALKAEVAPAEEVQIRIDYVSGVVGRYVCEFCHAENRLADGSFQPLEGRPARYAATPANPATPVPAPSTATAAPAAPVLVVDNKPLLDFSPTRQHFGDTYNPFGSEFHKGGY
jgi:hypothetical protein